jgi:hypothetical protein
LSGSGLSSVIPCAPSAESEGKLSETNSKPNDWTGSEIPQSTWENEAERAHQQLHQFNYTTMTNPKPELPVRPISELVADPEFPASAVGARVNIKGFIGVVAGVVNNSLKVRSAEGNTVSYNFHALRRLYGPPTPEPAPASPPVPEPQARGPVIPEPDFNAPLVPIEALAQKADFPACALGIFVDLHGFTGVVVQLVGRSLKVRSREGSTCSYNADGLRRVYAKAQPAIQPPTFDTPAPSA